MIRRLFSAALLCSAFGCTTLDLWDSPDVTIEERPCTLDSDCDNVRFEVDDSLRDDPCLVAERSCDASRGLCAVELRARDSDRDNYRDIACAGARTEFAPFEIDCDDTNGDAFPNADLDGDGFVVAGCGYGLPEDCDDGRATAFPGATVEACDGVVSTCTDTTPPLRRLVEDFDGDRFAPVELDASVCVDVMDGSGALLTIPRTDCDDTDALVYPNAPDACDGRHNDCAAVIGVGLDPGEDVDGDGFASPSSLSCDPDLGIPNSDCDDLNAKTYPGAPESCDLQINDCSKREDGPVARTIEDPDGDGRFAGNADCIDPVVNIECVGAAFDRFSSFCLPSGETSVAPNLPSISLMRTGDLNADGVDELLYVRDDGALTCPTSDAITLRYAFPNAGNPLGSTSTICDSAGTTVDVELADADGDAPLEIVTLTAAGTILAYDVAPSGAMTITAKPAMGFTVTSGVFAVGRFDGVATPVVVALEGSSLGFRPLDANALAGAPTEIDAAASGVTGVAIVDFDGNGVRDVLAYSSASTVITVYPGVNGGTFGSKITLDAGALLPGIGNLVTVLVGDVEGDGDGDLDLVVVGPTALGVLARRGSAFEGVPVGIRPNGELLSVGGIDPRDVAVADLDADGRREIVYSVRERDSVGYIDEIGTGVFAQHVFVADFDTATHLVAGDFDGDLDVDVAAFSEGLAQISRFQSFFVSNMAFGGRFVDRAFDAGLVDSGDFDVDGLTDLVGASALADGEIVVWRAHVRDFSTIDEVVALRASPGETFSGMAVGDLTGDLRPDIAVASEGLDQVGFVRGNGDLTFGARELLTTFDGAYAVRVADLDGDTSPEIVVASNGGAEGRLAIYARPVGQPTFTRTIVATGSAPCTELALGDVDDDGDLDVALACRTAGLSVFVNPGTVAGAWLEIEIDDGASGVADTTSVDLADVDRDGDADVISYRADTASVLVHQAAAGSVALTPAVFVVNVLSTTGAKVRGADLDRDGDADIVVAGLDTGSAMRLMQSVGRSRPRYATTLLRAGSTGRPSALGVVDLDRDGDDDVVTTVRGDRDVILFRSAAQPWWNH